MFYKMPKLYRRMKASHFLLSRKNKRQNQNDHNLEQFQEYLLEGYNTIEINPHIQFLDEEYDKKKQINLDN